MSGINFARDGQIGDEVWDSVYGNGSIKGFDTATHYSTIVRFVTGQLRGYDTKGFLGFNEEFPSLHWGHRTPPDQGQPPERPVWKLTKPTWCYVGSGTKQLICKVNDQGQYVDIQCYCWSKVSPCEPKDIPDWWPKEWV